MAKLSKDKIMLHMAKKDMSWGELSNRIGVSDSALRQLFKATNNQPRTIYNLSNALRVEPEEILEKP